MPRSRLSLSQVELDAALVHLRKDTVMGQLVKSLPAPGAGARRDPFHALIVAILNQLISRKVAAIIEKRLADLVGRPFRPAAVAAADSLQMRKLGMSESKVTCAKACANDALATDFSARSCRYLSDAEIIARIVALKGAGPWTAHMVLIFGLGRPDVMPDGDGGIRRATANLFGCSDLAATCKRLLREKRRWQPHNSVAAWYLWRSLG